MKLKHRIVGTILAIVFATTSALPAAGIPQVKSPPKTVSAPKVPVVKVPTAPKVPVVPKVVSAPKIPVAPKIVSAPKVPVIPKVVSAPKIPVAPKVVSAPKVPVIPKVVNAPKIPAAKIVKTPVTPKMPAIAVAPKIPTVAKAPAKAPATPKATATSTQAVTAGKISSKIVSNNSTNVAAVSGTRQAVRTAQQDNRQKEPDAGAKTDIPGLPARDVKVGSRSSGEKPGTGNDERAPSKGFFDALTGKGGATGAASGPFGDVLPKRDAPALTDISQSGKTFDQGFGTAPDVSGFNGDFLNPMSGISSGGGIGGLLGAAADKAGNGTPGGVAGMGTGLISDGGAASSGGQAGYSDDEGVKGRSDNKGLLGLLKERFGMNEKQTNEAVKTTVGIGDNRNGSEFLKDPNGDPAPATQPVAPAEPATEPTQTSSDGRNTVVTDADGTKHVYVEGKKVGVIAPGGAITPTESAGRPDPENAGTVKVDVVSQSASLQQQIAQSRSGKKGSQGGSADATPVDDGTSNVANGVVISQQGTNAAKNNMLGNPGQNGGLREGGTTANAPVRGNGAGAITPTNDQNMSSSGGRQDDPGNFFGNGVGPDQSRLNNANSSNNNEDESSNSSGTTTATQKKKK